MQPLQTVTDLVNKLFTYYECSFSTLDWNDKIDEYVDAIDDFISFDADLDDIYKKIRQEYPYRKLPLPFDIRKILSKHKNTKEIIKQVEHQDNGKQLVLVCVKDNYVRYINSFVISNTENTPRHSDRIKQLQKRFDNVKVYEFSKDATVFIKGNKLEDGSLVMTGEVWTPKTYNKDGEITEYNKIKVA